MRRVVVALMALLVMAWRPANGWDSRPYQPQDTGRAGAPTPLPSAGGWDSPPWTRATPTRPVRVPEDHVAHPEYRIEWWYYTGNVRGDDGRPYGYQVTFFRVGVDPAPKNPSAFAVRDLYMAHIALTDVEGVGHRFADRLNRAGVHWAGARADRYEVWNENWRVSLDAEGRHRIVAGTGTFALDLTLEPGKAVVLQGANGYSRKGQDPGNASHYYSLTRMPTQGKVRVDGRTVQVRGNSWMDHEFGTSALDAGTRGWDWFALQFDDGRELMLYQLRQDDGTAGPFSSGTLVQRDGSTLALAVTDFTVTPRRHWRSEASETTYPVEWEVRVPKAGLELTVTAAVDAQELRTRQSTNVTYWEGSVRVIGTDASPLRLRSGQARRPLTSSARPSPPEQVRGVGYLEMTGYSGAKMSDVMR